MALVLPYGDEPDFYERSIQFFEAYFLSFLKDTHFIEVHKYNCFIDQQTFNLITIFDLESCRQSFFRALNRTILLITIMLPLFLFVVFKPTLLRFKNFTEIEKIDLNNRAKSILVSILFPGMIYYLGVVSLEKLSLVFSLYLYIIWNNIFLRYVLSAAIIFIDLGNGVLVLSFVILFTLFHYTYSKMSKVGFIFIILAVSINNYFYGFYFLEYIFKITQFNYLAEIVSAYSVDGSYAYVKDKYFKLFRVLNTLVTSIFMTPSGIKVIPAYLIFSLFSVIFIWNYKHRFFGSKNYYDIEFNKDKLTALFSIIYVLNIVFIVPGYTNAKYFIFLLPFIFGFVLRVAGFYKVMIFVNSLTITVLIGVFSLGVGY